VLKAKGQGAPPPPSASYKYCAKHGTLHQLQTVTQITKKKHLIKMKVFATLSAFALAQDVRQMDSHERLESVSKTFINSDKNLFFLGFGEHQNLDGYLHLGAQPSF
jgi:hypothetical protein